MDCKKVEQRIIDLDFTDLNDFKDRGLAGHIEHCPECSASFDLVRTLRQQSAAPARSAEPDWGRFVQDVRSRLLSEACHCEKSHWKELGRFLSWLLRPGFGYGAVAAGVLALFLIVSPRIMETGRYLFTADSPVESPVPSGPAVMPVSFPTSAFDDHVSLPLEALSQEELVYLCNGLLNRLARQERLDRFQDVLDPDMEMQAQAKYISVLESRLSNLSPAELTRVAHSLEHMMSN